MTHSFPTRRSSDHPVPAKAQLSRHGVDDYELVADIERDQGLRAVRSHQIDRRDFMVAGEAHDRELAVVGDFRRLKVARTLDLVVQIARSIDDAVVKGAPNGTRLQRGDAQLGRASCRARVWQYG